MRDLVNITASNAPARTLSALASVRAGYPFRSAIPENQDGDVRVVQMRDVRRERVAWPGVVRTSLPRLPAAQDPQWLRPGDVLFVFRGTRYFAVALRDVPEKAVASTQFMVVRVSDQGLLLPEFLAWQLNQASAQAYFQQLAQGTAQRSLRRGAIEAVSIAVPPIEDQRYIATITEAFRRERDLMEDCAEIRERALAKSAGLSMIHRGSPRERPRAAAPEIGGLPEVGPAITTDEVRPMMGLHVALWAAADELRGAMEAAIYGECLLALFFLKYVSDAAWDDPRRFDVPDEARFGVLVAQRELPGNAQRIEATLRALERKNSRKLGGLFEDFRWSPPGDDDSTVQDRALGAVLEILNRDVVDLRPSVLGERQSAEAFAFLLMGMPSFSYSDAGELYTPAEISSLMAQLVAPSPGDSIHDPACGTAGLLLTCARFVQEQHHSKKYVLSGQEITRRSWRLARINALLHGEDESRFACGDTLREPLFVQGDSLERFDVVLANPPFSLDDWGWEEAIADRFGRFGPERPPRRRGDYAFILHMVRSMKPETGRMAVVVPHGVLFRGESEGKIRKDLIDRNLLDGVIGLPPKVFYNTGIPTALLLFRTGRKDDRVLFIDASRDFAIGRRRNQFRTRDIERIVTTWRARKEVPGYAYLASREEIAHNGYTLNVQRYVTSCVEEEDVELSVLLERLRGVEGELGEVRGTIARMWGELEGMGGMKS